jgi:Fe2+ transport system protein FeoA
MRLIDVKHNLWVKVLSFEGNAHFQDRLLQHGLYPGDRARILRSAPLDGPLLVEVSGREIAIGQGVAEKIMVEVDR